MQLLTTVIYRLRKHLCIPPEGLAPGHIFTHCPAKARAVLLPSRGKKAKWQDRAEPPRHRPWSCPIPFHLSCEVLNRGGK